MKRLLAVMVSSVFAAAVSGADIYHGFGAGNSDLTTQRLAADDFTGVQPSVGDSVNRYHGWGKGNPDLFAADRSDPSGSVDDPDIYKSISGNPDLELWGP